MNDERDPRIGAAIAELASASKPPPTLREIAALADSRRARDRDRRSPNTRRVSGWVVAAGAAVIAMLAVGLVPWLFRDGEPNTLGGASSGITPTFAATTVAPTTTARSDSTMAPGGASSFDDYIHRVRLGAAGLETVDLDTARAREIDTPLPPAWPDPDAVRVAREGTGEAGVLMVWEESPYGLVAISTTDVYSRSGGSFEDFVKGAVDNFGGETARIGDVDGVVLTSEYSRAVYFTRGSWTVAVEVSSAVSTQEAIGLATSVLAAP